MGALGVILTTFISSPLLMLFLGTYHLPTVLHIAIVTGLCVLGMLSLVTGVIWLYEGTASGGWPTTEAVIVETMLGRGAGKRGAFPRAAIVRYRYTVTGQTYSSSRWMVGDEHYAGSTVEAQRHLGQYGDSTTIRYNPLWPANAVLRPGVANVTWALLITGPWLLFVAHVLHRWWRERR